MESTRERGCVSANLSITSDPSGLNESAPNDSVCSWTRIGPTTLWSQAIGPLTTLLEPHILPRGSSWVSFS